MKVLTVVGARPQFIKAATVSRAFRKAGMEEYIVHTGQHFDPGMSAVFFREMEIPEPKRHLHIHSLSHGAMTGRMLEQIETVIHEERPSLVLVYGDTNSTLAGALAAVKCHVPVAHVEAGLRSFDMRMPEEVNRILTDRVSKFLFCPTDTAVSNLRKEGFDNFNSQIIRSGDVMFDAMLYYREKARKHSDILKTHDLEAGNFALATLHRAENTDDPSRLRSIMTALDEIHTTRKVVLPLHPRTRALMTTRDISSNVVLIPPVSYFDMLSLLDACTIVLTDSGGLQKEAYFSGKFCITMRDQTEWVELVDAGCNVVTGADSAKIIHAFNQNDNKTFQPASLYGDGHAADLIVDTLVRGNL